MSQRVVFSGGTMITADPSRLRLAALAVEGDRIVAVDRAAQSGESADTIDLAGKTLVPGFHDGHCHPVLGGTQLAEAPIWGVDAMDVLLERVRTYAEQHPDREWIRGFGYMPGMLPGAMGDARVLDEVVSDRPVWLTAADGHTSWVNTVALERAGITAATQDPRHGAIGRREDGAPSGALMESAQGLIGAVSPSHTLADKIEGGRAALSEFRSKGVTWVQDALAEPEDVDAFVELARTDRTLPRANVALRAEPDRWQSQQTDFLTSRERTRRLADETGGRVSAETVKFFADGVIESGTGALIDEYCDHPGSHGIPNWTPEELAAAVTAFDAEGFQIHIHAIGDAAIRNALDAIEAAIARNGQRDRRPVIAHTQLVHPDDLGRFDALGVIANFEPLWARLDPTMVELTIPRLGPERSSWQYPIGSMLRSGAPISFGSDWPVSSLNPLEGIAVAVTRQMDSGEPSGGWLPHERIDLDSAIRFYTAAGSYQAFADQVVGTLAPGQRADLVLLGADLDRISPNEIGSVPIEMVWMDGVVVYSVG